PRACRRPRRDGRRRGCHRCRAEAAGAAGGGAVVRVLPKELSERREQRRARARNVRGPRAWRRALLRWGRVVVGLVAGVVFLFFFSAAFVVEDVQVSGVEGEVAESVEHHADIPQGRPLARVSESRLSERVLTGDKRVRSISVERRWPSTVVY